MGILSVGILGMAALVPLGAYELVEANKLDQSSTAGRASFRDMEVRSYLQPKQWVDTQMGMFIDPDPTNSVVASPQSYQQRIITYPYLPPLVFNNYIGPGGAQLKTAVPPTGLSTPPAPDYSTAPQLYPVLYPYIYNPSSPVAATPIGVNLFWNSSTTYPQLPPPYPPGYFVTSPNPYPPFAATAGQVLVFDPLGVSEAANTYLKGGNGPATVPPYGSAPAQWTFIQTFPYQQTYDPGAPLLPRITMLPEWPRYPINGTVWSQTPPLSPLPTWPVPPVQNLGVQQNWSASTPYNLPPVPAPGYGPWPQPWFQSTSTASATIQTQPRFMPLTVADRIFRSNSDLIFNPLNPTNPSSDRPTLGFTYDTTGTNRQEPLYQGNYSWFATVSPASAQVDATAANLQDTVMHPDSSALMNTRQYNVSVVICQNRVVDMPPTPLTDDILPGEWMVPAKINPGSLGGGEVTLYAAQNPTDPDPQRAQHQADWLATLKPGQWLMLSGITVAGEMRQGSGGPIYWPRFRTIANWYRILAVDDGTALTSAGGFRNVTLNGPDWPQGVQWDDPAFNGTGNTPPVLFGTSPPPIGVQFANLNMVNVVGVGSVYIYAYATVVEGVVGVYQKTITVDGDSPFGSQ
ncbi:MAG TPA: hypothetical protein VGN12_15000 [Pirellulales bacterium]